MLQTRYIELFCDSDVQFYTNVISTPFYRILAISRWLYTSTKELSELFGPDIPPEVQNVYVENMRKQSYEQGLGRHSESEINELGLGDLEAISHFLGT